MKRRHLAVPVALAALGLAASCTNQDSNATPAATTRTTAAPATPPVTVPSITGDTPCPAADGSSPTILHFEKPPPTCIDPAKTYRATVETSEGTFTIDLDPKGAPASANNIVVLARYHYFDGLPFDTSAPTDYVGTGVHLPPAAGDPGYRLEPQLPPGGKPDYQHAGTVIIDTEQVEADGSLFIVLLTDKGVAPRFTIVGTVNEGLDVAKTINARIYPDGPNGTDLANRDLLPHVVRVTISER